MPKFFPFVLAAMFLLMSTPLVFGIAVVFDRRRMPA